MRVSVPMGDDMARPSDMIRLPTFGQPRHVDPIYLTGFELSQRAGLIMVGGGR